MKSLNTFKGCLIGGAVGDALGYPIEFYNIGQIKNIYGEDGITEFKLNNGKAIISDDTQMTLFTANGLLIGTTRAMTRGIMAPYPYYISLCYKDWLKTQISEDFGFEASTFSWLNNVSGMNHSRDPRRTCIEYLMNNKLGSISNQ